MPKEFSRTRRVAEQIRRDIAQLMREHVRDPRMAMVSITLVQVVRDLSHAKVFVTYIGEAAERKSVVEALNQASGVLRRELGRGMHIRVVPRLQFVYDEVIERGAKLSALIDAAVASDQARHAEEADDAELDDAAGDEESPAQ